jgi:hypothetical protein
MLNHVYALNLRPQTLARITNCLNVGAASHEDIWRELEVWLHALLTSALEGGERSAAAPGRFTPRVHCTHCMGVEWASESASTL